MLATIDSPRICEAPNLGTLYRELKRPLNASEALMRTLLKTLQNPYEVLLKNHIGPLQNPIQSPLHPQRPRKFKRKAGSPGAQCPGWLRAPSSTLNLGP